MRSRDDDNLVVPGHRTDGLNEVTYTMAVTDPPGLDSRKVARSISLQTSVLEMASAFRVD